jgi:hypothetical protein
VAITLRTPRVRPEGTIGFDGSAWLFVLLALLTVLPAACVLWFMNEALTRESSASHQRVLEAYRGQLRLVRSRLDPIWRAHATNLNAEPGTPEERFHRLITSERAEGVILLTADGAVEYPTRTAQQDRVTETIEQQLVTATAAKSDDRKPMVEAIAARLNDYSRPMAAPTRLEFMTRLRQCRRTSRCPPRPRCASRSRCSTPSARRRCPKSFVKPRSRISGHCRPKTIASSRSIASAGSRR